MTDFELLILELYRQLPEDRRQMMILSAALSACANEAIKEEAQP